MTILTHGRLTLPQPHQSFFFSNWDLLDYQLTVNGPSVLVGYNLLVGADETFNGPLTNNGTLVLEDGSDLTIQNNLSGSGSIVANHSSVLIAGSAAASQTILLMNNSQLFLGQPGLAATIDMDATSEIQLYNPTTIAGVVSDLTANGSPYESLPFHGLFHINSLTPGYTPQAEFTFGGPGDQVIGVTIVDKPTPSTTIVGSTVSDPTGSISATDGSNVGFSTSSAPTSDIISLDGTSHLAIARPLGMSFLATIDMVSGSKVYLIGIQGSGTPSSITEYPQLNLVDFYSGSTLEAQLHIHNESPGTTIWAAAGFKEGLTLTDSVSQPANQAGVGYPPDVPVPVHVVG